MIDKQNGKLPSWPSIPRLRKAFCSACALISSAISRSIRSAVASSSSASCCCFKRSCLAEKDSLGAMATREKDDMKGEEGELCELCG